MTFSSGDVVYDLESLPNLFLAGFMPVVGRDDEGYLFEISDRRNDTAQLYRYLTSCRRMFGFNNMFYDWPVLDYFLTLLQTSPNITANDLYRKSCDIINGGWDQRYRHVIWKPAITQVDMFMMHHLDRFSIGLKQTEFNMRSRSIVDMPIPADTYVTIDQIPMVIDYNVHDIRETRKMVLKSEADIAYRQSLGTEWLNHNDGKIGSKFFENELKAAGVEIYNRDGSKRSTPRHEGVRLASVILPFINFTRGTLQVQLEQFRQEHIFKLEVEEGLKKKERMLRRDGSEVKYTFDLDGFGIDVKLGGIHGSVEKRIVTNEGARLLDFDVTSYYPSIAIVHNIFPAHLGLTFCKVYGKLKQRRITLPKEDPTRGTLKFALNVPFGQSNNRHSIFFDPAYMLAITINGQLMLCMLAEQLANIPDVELIQVNTDGVTVRVPAHTEQLVRKVLVWWQQLTGMDLEETEYRRMAIRDANNYIAEGIDGKRKRKGAYDYKKTWRQDHSELIVAKAAETSMLDDIDVEDYITNHADPFDFMIFRKGKMELNGEPVTKNIRYYISTSGGRLSMRYPPLKGKTEDRRIGVHAEGLAHAVPAYREGRKTPISYSCSACDESFGTKGSFDEHNKNSHCWGVKIVNDFDGVMPNDIDYRYYIREAEKLIIE